MQVQPLKLKFRVEENDLKEVELYYGKNIKLLGLLNILPGFYSSDADTRKEAILDIKRQIEKMLQDNYILGFATSLKNIDEFKFNKEKEELDLLLTSDGDIIVQ